MIEHLIFCLRFNKAKAFSEHKLLLVTIMKVSNSLMWFAISTLPQISVSLHDCTHLFKSSWKLLTFQNVRLCMISVWSSIMPDNLLVERYSRTLTCAELVCDDWNCLREWVCIMTTSKSGYTVLVNKIGVVSKSNWHNFFLRFHME